MIRLGEIEIYPISDGVLWMDSGGAWGLVPRPLWSRYLQPDEQHRVPMVLTSLLVRAAGRTILVDTGLGEKIDEKSPAMWGLERAHGTVIDGLARLGVAPADVELVVNTHLHSDHCAGNTARDADGVPRPTFRNATYLAQRREYEDAMHPNERTRATYFLENYAPLAETGQLHLLDGDTEIVPGMRVVVTPGHTPAHQSVLFEGGGEQALFVADMAMYAIQFERLAWISAYDVEPLVSLETKRRWQRWALETGALLLFQHDTQVGAAHLVKDGNGRPQLAPVQIELV